MAATCWGDFSPEPHSPATLWPPSRAPVTWLCISWDCGVEHQVLGCCLNSELVLAVPLSGCFSSEPSWCPSRAILAEEADILPGLILSVSLHALQACCEPPHLQTGLCTISTLLKAGSCLVNPLKTVASWSTSGLSPGLGLAVFDCDSCSV